MFSLSLQTLVKHQEKHFLSTIYSTVFLLFLGVVFWFLHFLVCKSYDGFIKLLSFLTFLIAMLSFLIICINFPSYFASKDAQSWKSKGGGAQIFYGVNAF